MTAPDVPAVPERCRVVQTSDGTTVRVRGAGDLTDADRAALGEVVAAVHAMWDAMPADERDELERRQQAARKRNRARLARVRGEV